MPVVVKQKGEVLRSADHDTAPKGKKDD
jgi:hypothetical protein